MRDKWINYIEDCDENEIGPWNYIREEDIIDYNESKLKFYVDMEKETDELLNHYFNNCNLNEVDKGSFGHGLRMMTGIGL